MWVSHTSTSQVAFLCPDVNSMGLPAIAFGDQDCFEQCYTENRVLQDSFAKEEPIDVFVIGEFYSAADPEEGCEVAIAADLLKDVADFGRCVGLPR